MNTTYRASSNARFQRGSGVYVCRCCGHKTRSTGGDGAGLGLCDTCFDLAGEENHLSDTDKLYSSPANILAMIAAVEAKSGNLTLWADLKAAALASQALSAVDDLDPPQACPACDSEPVFLGALGTTSHFRCRACGWQFSN